MAKNRRICKYCKEEYALPRKLECARCNNSDDRRRSFDPTNVLWKQFLYSPDRRA